MNKTHPLVFYLKNFTTVMLGPTPRLVEMYGSKMYLRPRTIDGYIVNEIFENENYRPTKALSLPSNPLFVDLGAQIGLFSIWANNIYKGIELVVIEPYAPNIAILEKNLTLHSIKTKIVTKALYERSTNTTFRKSRVNTGGHTISDKGKIQVPTATLRQMIGDRTVDYLKVDIEGSEKYLLSGDNLEFIQQYVNFIKMEVHHSKGVSLKQVVDTLEAVGFETVALPQRTIKPHSLSLLEAYRLSSR